MTHTRTRVLLVASLVLAACSGGNDERAAGDGSDSAAARRTDSAGGEMAGMDHSKMPGMATDTGGSMTGMDHSNMPGMGTSTAQGAPGGSMAGMDHSNMPGMATAPSTGRTAGAARSGTASGSSAMAGMDHSNMPGMNAPATRSQSGTSRGSTMNGMAGMDHSTMPMGTNAQQGMQIMPGMPGTQAAPDEAAQKLQRLMAELVEDPEVRQRILADSALRRGWQNPTVRQSVRKQP
jgi:uncharacterized protein involved in copper resistance